MIENYMVNPTMAFDAAMQGQAQGRATGEALLAARASNTADRINNSNLLQNQKEFQDKQALAVKEAERQKQYQTRIQGLMSKPEITPKDILDVNLEYPPLSESTNKSFNNYQDHIKQAGLTAGVQAFSALKSGDTATSVRILNEYAAAAKANGDVKGASTAESYANLIGDGSNPIALKTATLSMGNALVAAQGPQNFANNFATFNKIEPEIAKTQSETGQNVASTFKTTQEGRKAQVEADAMPDKLAAEQAKINAETNNYNSQIRTRADQLLLDRDKLNVETLKIQAEMAAKQKNAIGGELLADDKKLINEASLRAGTKRTSASRMLGVADQIMSQEEDTSGWAGDASEYYKKITGTQDGKTVLLGERGLLMTSVANSMLPDKGAASDTDVKMAREPLLPASAGKVAIAAQMRGLAKMQYADSIVDEAVGSWASTFGSLRDAPVDIVIDGIQVKKGMKATDFARAKVNVFVDGGYKIPNSSGNNRTTGPSTVTPEQSKMNESFATPR